MQKAALIDVSDTEWRKVNRKGFWYVSGAALIDVSDTEWRSKALGKLASLAEKQHSLMSAILNGGGNAPRAVPGVEVGSTH